MGAFRTFLALLVVCAHLTGVDEKVTIIWLTGGAVMAVNVFFLLSGFYMTLVLDRKYKNSVKPFLLSRALRLYPLYWVVVVVTFLCCWVTKFNNSLIMPIGFSETLPMIHKAVTQNVWLTPILIIQNITFLGLDFNNLLCITPPDSGIHLIKGGQCSLFPITRLTAVGQAWSLGVELLFYLAIPFILRGGSKAIFAAIIIAAAANVIASLIGIDHLPYNRNIFFIPLIYFMMGVISFRSYARWGHYLPGKKAYWPMLVITIGLALSYTYNFDYGFHAQDTSFWSGINSIYYIIIALLVPALFHASKQSKLDSFLGEFSYPIYMTHHLGFVLFLTLSNMLGFDIKYGFLRFAFDMSCIAVVAVAGFLLIVRPIEILRRRKTAEERCRLIQADSVSIS